MGDIADDMFDEMIREQMTATGWCKKHRSPITEWGCISCESEAEYTAEKREKKKGKTKPTAAPQGGKGPQ